MAKIYCYEIKRLAFEEAKKLVPNYDPTVFDDNALKRKYDNANGNLIFRRWFPFDEVEENPIDTLDF
ncbi:hypothetical protein [Cohnella cellulosilytica]|uniref:hypothetical protein n=1 Tax=Cohnella cellulosilytica TaxID=986710 RepID=UPI0036178391